MPRQQNRGTLRRGPPPSMAFRPLEIGDWRLRSGAGVLVVPLLLLISQPLGPGSPLFTLPKQRPVKRQVKCTQSQVEVRAGEGDITQLDRARTNPDVRTPDGEGKRKLRPLRPRYRTNFNLLAATATNRVGRAVHRRKCGNEQSSAPAHGRAAREQRMGARLVLA